MTEQQNWKEKEVELLLSGETDEETIESIRKERDRWHNLCLELSYAITNMGENPKWHKRIMESHRKEWPFLWKKIDNIVNTVGAKTKAKK